jgi:glycosyltransferase involved in cell wall biosynthesis
MAERVHRLHHAPGDPEVEVKHIVVDGGSTDGTPEYAASRGCTVLTREKPGIAFAINEGAANASGDLIGFLGCNDILLPGALEEVARHTGMAADAGSSKMSGGCANAG